MAFNLALKITEALPKQWSVQVDFRDGNRAKFFGVSDRVPAVIKHCRNHPVRGLICISAADDVHVIFAGARLSQHGIAAPDWPGDDFRSIVAELSGDFRKERWTLS